MNELAIGIAAVVLVALVLLLSVTRELAPAGGLKGRGRWLLAAGLGMGILAFALKLLFIAAIEIAPPRVWTMGELARPTRTLMPEPPIPVAETNAYRWEALPSDAPAPLDNPTTPEKVILGEHLFFDRNLSLDRSISCGSCHEPFARAGTDGRALALGVGGQIGVRNAPTVWNSAFQSRLFWDGRTESLEEQAKGPLVNPREMAMPSLESVVERVRQQPAYLQEFRLAFGSERFGIDEVAAAIAAYERTLITPDTPYDRFVRGDSSALSTRQLRGMALFETVGCVQCHYGPNFSGAGLSAPESPLRMFPVFDQDDVERFGLREDRGAAGATGDRGVWRIPTLRNVALTAPYFHNGSVATLDEAVRVMARVQLGIAVEDAEPPPAPRIARGLNGSVRLGSARALSERDIGDLVAFLAALSDQELVKQRTKRTHAPGAPRSAFHREQRWRSPGGAGTDAQSCVSARPSRSAA